MGSIRRAMMGAGLLLVTVLACAGEPAAATPVKLDIKSQPMADALNQWAQATGFQVIFPEESATAKLVSPEVRGRYVPVVALTKLLENSGLRYEYLNKRTVSVKVAQVGEVKPSSDRDKENGRPLVEPRAQSESPRSGEQSGQSEGSSSQGTGSGISEKLDEVVVTAQKRIERLQDVPVPVTAISADALVEGNQLRLQDYYTSIPGFSVTPGFDGSPSLTIRGIATGVYTNPTVGITVDDVPLGSSTALGGSGFVPDLDPSDLARVEVLRGPQGTLYGVSSIGGLLKFVTVDPSTAGFSGRIQAGLSGVRNGNETGYSVRGAVNVPLSDTLAIRASGFTRRDPGYIDNIESGQRGVNETDVYGARFSALWRPSDVFSVKVAALLQRQTLYGGAYVDVGPGLGDLQSSYLPGSTRYDKKVQAYSATATAKLGIADLVAVSGYSVNDISTTGDSTTPYWASLSLPAFGVDRVVGTNSTRTYKFTQEIRLSMPVGPRVDWLLGAFYTNEDSPFLQQIKAADSNGVIVGLGSAYNFPTTYREYAAFTDLTFQVTDRFDVQIGGRESHNKQTYSEVDSGPFVGPSPFINPEVDAKSNAFTYLVTPRLKLTPDLMLYARLASGYRSGGPNPTCVAIQVPCQFGPDKTSNYELGAKGDVLNHLLSFDASLYYINWKDIQLSLVSPTFYYYYVNGSEAKSKGVELSLESRPVEGLVVSAWVALNDSKLTKAFPPQSAAYGASGDRLPFGSRFSGNFAVDKDFPLGRNVTGSVGGSLSYIGERIGEFNTASLRQVFPAYAQTNLRAGVKFDSWDVRFFVNNVTDKRALLYGGPGSTLLPMAYMYIQPRTIGLSAARAF